LNTIFNSTDLEKEEPKNQEPPEKLKVEQNLTKISKEAKEEIKKILQED
jgi:hypothetical protein